MQTIALIGLLGGLITGISPCIMPVLPSAKACKCFRSLSGRAPVRPDAGSD
jgi:cytochrome c biogenesis protein CcdA